MANPLLTPDGAYVVGAVVAASGMVGSAYIARRGSKRAESTEHAVAEHEATRQTLVDALGSVVGPLNGRLDEMHAQLNDIRDWQTLHTKEHAVSELTRPLEYRKRG